MSFDVALSRITQIVGWEHGIVSPTSATSAPAATTPTGATTSFTDALASAQGALSTSAAGAPGATGGAVAAAGDAPAQVQAMQNMADSLLGKPYVWGGGHGSWAPQAGYDCSGFVSAVLHAGGFLGAPADTTSLPSQAGMVAGPGQYVTVYDRAQPGSNGHVIIEINGQFYESGGEKGAWGGGGGVAKIARPSDAYLATFPNVLHPQGL
jgi:cell wall-associated NlpC family hydrolase